MMNRPMRGGISFLWIRLSKTVGALYWRPSWKTITGAGLAASYCLGTYTQYSRHVPRKILLLSKVYLVTSPLGTPSCAFESGPSGYSSAAERAIASRKEQRRPIENGRIKQICFRVVFGAHVRWSSAPGQDGAKSWSAREKQSVPSAAPSASPLPRRGPGLAKAPARKPPDSQQVQHGSPQKNPQAVTGFAASTRPVP